MAEKAPAELISEMIREGKVKAIGSDGCFTSEAKEKIDKKIVLSEAAFSSSVDVLRACRCFSAEDLSFTIVLGRK